MPPKRIDDFLPPYTYRIFDQTAQAAGCFVLEIDGEQVPLKPVGEVACDMTDWTLVQVLARYEVIKRYGVDIGEHAEFRWVQPWTGAIRQHARLTPAAG
jgi:hypothetical protein